ncbi:MAG: hypothetical protein KAI53_04605 [Candidatus Aenigmarchaeota archaeon]|nr:hypothetical protein [Candidatus Aenigmarchaeota archaeon]
MDELKTLEYSLKPFGLKEDNGPFTGSYNIENVPEILDDKTVFLASDTNTHHGLAYSLIRYVAKTEENLDVHVVDAHFDWEKESEDECMHIGCWGFLKHVAELPQVTSISNWGCRKKYLKNIEIRKKDCSVVDIVSSTTLPDKKTISKNRKKREIYLSVDQDVMGSESMYDPKLTGEIELKTLVSDLLLFTSELQPNYMDIFLDSDGTAEYTRKAIFEMKMEAALEKLKMIYDGTQNEVFIHFKNEVEKNLHMICITEYYESGTIPNFLSEESTRDEYAKNVLLRDELDLIKLANHAFYTDAELCRYLIDGMEGTLDKDRIYDLFIHNVDPKNFKKLKEVHALTKKIIEEKEFGDFLPTYLSQPDILKFVQSNVTGFVKALNEKIKS